MKQASPSASSGLPEDKSGLPYYEKGSEPTPSASKQVHPVRSGAGVHHLMIPLMDFFNARSKPETAMRKGGRRRAK